ncbi:MAG: HAMP domain-containing protein, partial [Planctomycetales bacterium]|nr:HAMP domain-containing protein [Planctomycetales bacterium]
MAYRSFKRVLVETSLERKCLVLFGVALFLLIAGGFWYAERNAEELVEERTQATGRDFIEFKLVLRHVQPFVEKAGYTPSEAGVLDELGSHLQSRDYGWELITTEPDRCTQESQLDGAREPKPGEVAIIQRLLERFETQFTEDVESDLLDDTVNVGTGAELVPTPADVAQTMTSSLVSGIEPVSEFDPKGSHYHYYQPVYWRESCGICHGFTKLADDDRPMALQGPRAIIKVAIPAEETQSSIRASRGILLATAIMTVFLSMVALYLVVRLIIIRPLNHLRDVSEEISRGNTTLRADIQTNDEFEDLGASFNRMLRHLVDTQEELRKVNTDLDGKVDQLAQANMQLHEMNRVKSDFLANMSHELRTPLNSIIGFSDVLKRIQTLDSKQKRYVENIGRSGRILLEMINDILDLAKMESGKMDLRLTEFDIVRVITAQCDLVRALSEEKNIDLLMQLPDGMPLMFQDQSK